MTVYSVANVRPRSSSCTDSCSTVNPVTYDVPAHAPTRPIARAAGGSSEQNAARIRNAPVPITANSNTVSRGSRFWKMSSSTTPVAAPIPSAVISTPNVALSPSSPCFANAAPSGIMAPPPMRPTPSPTMTPRTRGWCAMKWSPSLMSRIVCVQSIRSWGSRSRARGIGSPKTMIAEAMNVQESTRRASVSWSTCSVDSASNDPSHAASAASSENTIEASGKVAYDATSERLFADASCGLVDEVRDRRVLGRPPEQREDLQPERDEHEAGERCRRTGA